MSTRRIIYSIAGAVLFLVFCYAVTWALSRDFAHEGADTPVAQRFALTWSWASPVINALHVEGPLGAAIGLGLPLLAYSALIFSVLTVIGIPRPTHHELQSNGSA